MLASKHLKMKVDRSMKLRFVLLILFAFLQNTEAANASCLVGEGKLVKYNNSEYCARYDAALNERILERNKVISLLNDTQVFITQLTKTTSDKMSCTKVPMLSREAQNTCLHKLYETKGLLQATVKTIVEYRTRITGINVPVNLKAGYLQNLSDFESGTLASLVSIDKAIDSANASMKASLTKWLDLKSDQWRSDGANRVFCATLQSLTGAEQSWVLAAQTSEMQGDSFGVKQSLVKLQSAQARAESGYKLCGLNQDKNYKNIQLALSEVKLIADRQNTKSNLNKACSQTAIAKWPKLSLACKAKSPPLEALLYSIHRALAGEYQEEM